MSEERTPFFEPSFNRAVKITSRDDRLTSDAGVVLLREADHRLGLVESLGERLEDPRNPGSIRYTLTELLRERVYSLALGYSAADDVDLLAHDPVVRMATWDRPGDRVLDERLASQPTQSRLLDTLSQNKGNLEALRGSLSDWVARHLRATGREQRVMRGTLDIDGFPIIARGLQSGSEYNGQFKKRVFYPLVAGFAPEGTYESTRGGDGFVHAILRRGAIHDAEGALRFIRTALKRSSSMARKLDVRFDSAFAVGKIMDPLTDDGTKFVGRLRNNNKLHELAEPYVGRCPGRPPKEGYEHVVELGSYQSKAWRHSQRLILVIVDKPHPKTGQLDMFPYYFFLITNWIENEMSASELLLHYRQRGTFEDRIGELSQAVSPRLSSPDFRENEVILLLSLLAVDLASMLRGELERTLGTGWDLTRFQTTVLRVGGRVVKQARRLFVDVVRAVLPIWQHLTRRISHWKLPPGWSPPRGPSKRQWVDPPEHAHRSAVLRT